MDKKSIARIIKIPLGILVAAFFASAAALILFAIVFTITTINLMVSRKTVFYN